MDPQGERRLLHRDRSRRRGRRPVLLRCLAPRSARVDDVAEIAESLPSGTAAAVIAWENTWATAISRVVADAGGVVLAHERIPTGAVDSLLDLIDDTGSEQS
ncbi:DUF6325 family protein [Aeromicrobium sp. UC242_57]|uniref:DUF6325 family protein n=1 Tax=Aeromicrobium sp. UC242_57 TaxID=3374624 RepID=UPI0037957E2F